MNFTNNKNFSDFFDSQIPCTLQGEGSPYSPSRVRSQTFTNMARASIESVSMRALVKIQSSCEIKEPLLIPERVKDVNEESDPFHLFDTTSFEEGLQSSQSTPEADFLKVNELPVTESQSNESQSIQNSEEQMHNEFEDVVETTTRKENETVSESKDQLDLKRIRQKQAEASRRYRLKKKAKLASTTTKDLALSTQTSNNLLAEVA